MLNDLLLLAAGWVFGPTFSWALGVLFRALDEVLWGRDRREDHRK